MAQTLSVHFVSIISFVVSPLLWGIVEFAFLLIALCSYHLRFHFTWMLFFLISPKQDIGMVIGCSRTEGPSLSSAALQFHNTRHLVSSPWASVSSSVKWVHEEALLWWQLERLNEPQKCSTMPGIEDCSVRDFPGGPVIRTHLPPLKPYSTTEKKVKGHLLTARELRREGRASSCSTLAGNVGGGQLNYMCLQMARKHLEY